MAALLQGLLLGFSIAAPVGPIGVLCIRRTLAEGRRSGLATGLGAATADAFYGSIAAFGLTALAEFLIGQGYWLRPFGGLVIGLLGARALLSPPPSISEAVVPIGHWRAYATTVFLTLSNPLTILSFTAAYAGMGLGTRMTRPADAAMLVAGVFVGSALWWLILTTMVGAFRAKLHPPQLVWANRISGVVLIAFAAVILVGAGG
jgi:threonine/homoserine/homoserine lactone efflux protein